MDHGSIEAGPYAKRGLKYWCELMGLAGGSVRAPLLPLNGEERNELRDDLVRCGLVSTELGCGTTQYSS